jgi:Domain of unknown function (DUF4124)
LVAVAAQAAVIYKWTDAQGVVHYSDQPQPGAERIVTSSPQTYSGARSGGSSNAGKANGPAANGPTQVSVVSPSAEQTFFGDEPITARAAVTPALKDSQTISWTLNGSPVSVPAGSAMSVTLQSLDRGTYSIAATLSDSDTGETINSAAVTFYVRQPSALSPQHKASH